jgi:hypothetical protein
LFYSLPIIIQKSCPTNKERQNGTKGRQNDSPIPLGFVKKRAVIPLGFVKFSQLFLSVLSKTDDYSSRFYQIQPNFLVVFKIKP